MSQKSISQFSQELSQALNYVQHLAHSLLKKKADAFIKGKITLPQYLVLDSLYTSGPMKMKGIAAKIHTSLPAASGLIDRLVKMKMVKRKYGKKDRRVILADLTPVGRKTVADTREARKEVIKKIFSPLTHKERQAYLDILNKIKSKFYEKNNN